MNHRTTEDETMSLMISRRANPLAEVRRLNQLLDETFTGWPFTAEPGVAVTSAWLPPTDIFENADGINIMVELPGLKPEDVKLTLENHTLTIRGEKKQTAEEKTTTVHRYERSYGSFERSFSLPTSVDADKVSAAFENGVLTITLPKAERAKPKEITVAAK
jgi:HSP20 family protein